MVFHGGKNPGMGVQPSFDDPDKKTYRVRDAVTRRSLGNVDEAFVLSLNDAGEDDDGTPRRFVIAGRTWLIRRRRPRAVRTVRGTGQRPRQGASVAG